MKPVEKLYEYVENVLREVSSEENTRKIIGITDVKNTYWRDFAGWYVKVDDMKGVYEMLLTDYEVSPLENKSGKREATKYLKNSFILKYYPHPDEPFFDDFALYEKIMRFSEIFNWGEKETPNLKMKDSIHGSYYTVGSLYLFIEEKGKSLRLMLETQDKWIDFRVKGIPIEVKKRVKWGVKPGKKDRNVPGWEICWKLFDKIVKMYCYRYHTSPVMSYLVNLPGRLWYINGKETRFSYSWRHFLRILEVGFILTEDKAEQEEIMSLFKKIIEFTSNKVNTEPKNHYKPKSTFKTLHIGDLLYASGEDLQFLNEEWWRIVGRQLPQPKDSIKH